WPVVSFLGFEFGLGLGFLLNFLLRFRFRDFFSKRSNEFSSITSTDSFLVSTKSLAKSSNEGNFCPDLLNEMNSCVWLTENLCQFIPLLSYVNHISFLKTSTFTQDAVPFSV